MGEFGRYLRGHEDLTEQHRKNIDVAKLRKGTER
jgi:hypothetical protein